MNLPPEHDKLTGPTASGYLDLTRAAAPFSWWPDAVGHVDEVMAQDGGHDWGHLGRVFANARKLWQAEAAQDLACWEVVAGAALFHDVINLPKDSPERHLASTYAAAHAADWFEQHTSWSAAQRDALAHAITAHSFSSGFTAETLPAKLLSDADRLDALGAVGIARTFAVGGILQRPLFHPTDPLAAHREPDDGIWSVDHFFVKLLRLPELMHTAAGRAEADKRAQTMRVFLQALAQEALI